MIVTREPGLLQPFRPLPGRQAETGLKRRGGEIVADEHDGIEARIPRSRKQAPKAST